MRNVSENVEENIPWYVQYFFLQKSCRLCDNVGKYSRAGQATDDNMAHKHCVLDTNTHSEYVMVIAFPLQQWLHERASLLPYSTLPVLF